MILSAALLHKPDLVPFLCCPCPFVKHCEAELSRLQLDLGDRGLLIGIAGNSSRSHPQAGAGAMAQPPRIGLG